MKLDLCLIKIQNWRLFTKRCSENRCAEILSNPIFQPPNYRIHSEIALERGEMKEKYACIMIWWKNTVTAFPFSITYSILLAHLWKEQFPILFVSNSMVQLLSKIVLARKNLSVFKNSFTFTYYSIIFI